MDVEKTWEKLSGHARVCAGRRLREGKTEIWEKQRRRGPEGGARRYRCLLVICGVFFSVRFLFGLHCHMLGALPMFGPACVRRVCDLFSSVLVCASHGGAYIRTPEERMAGSGCWGWCFGEKRQLTAERSVGKGPITRWTRGWWCFGTDRARIGMPVCRFQIDKLMSVYVDGYITKGTDDVREEWIWVEAFPT